jgi:hypothetical protein
LHKKRLHVESKGAVVVRISVFAGCGWIFYSGLFTAPRIVFEEVSILQGPVGILLLEINPGSQPVVRVLACDQVFLAGENFIGH